MDTGRGTQEAGQAVGPAPHVSSSGNEQSDKTEGRQAALEGPGPPPCVPSAGNEQRIESDGRLETVQAYLDSTERENLIPGALLDELWR